MLWCHRMEQTFCYAISGGPHMATIFRLFERSTKRTHNGWQLRCVFVCGGNSPDRNKTRAKVNGNGFYYHRRSFNIILLFHLMSFNNLFARQHILHNDNRRDAPICFISRTVDWTRNALEIRTLFENEAIAHRNDRPSRHRLEERSDKVFPTEFRFFFSNVKSYDAAFNQL